MNKANIIELLADQHGLSKVQAGKILDTLITSVVTTVKKGGVVTLAGFGSFKQIARPQRNGRNPATGDKIKIPAAKLPKFTPGSAFKAAVDPKAAKRKAEKAAKTGKA
jgi:DNA-binding protein HU-beta